MNQKALALVITIAFLCAGCSPGMIANLAVSGTKMVKSADTRSKAQSLKRKPTLTNGDSIKYANYYIYRSGSFVGSALSCLVYDNNEYITVANLKTFEKVDHVMPGDHVFTSTIDADESVNVHFDPGKTYIIQVFANMSIRKGVLIMMDQNRIKKEIAKGLFFKDKFTENGLKLEDISYNDYFTPKK